jgi:metal-dependent amidase/aminoacylase/carboxypeptidase family protein
VRAPVGGVDTAFVAVHEGPVPGPYVAVLAEYDALPGVGHGCGHNLIAAGAAAAAIAGIRALPGHPGTSPPPRRGRHGSSSTRCTTR